jgi:hypothetical protein
VRGAVIKGKSLKIREKSKVKMWKGVTKRAKRMNLLPRERD